jgi:hypothetical protein
MLSAKAGIRIWWTATSVIHPRRWLRGTTIGEKNWRMVEVFGEHVSSKIDGVIDKIEGAKGHKTAQPISIVPFLYGLIRG